MTCSGSPKYNTIQICGTRSTFRFLIKHTSYLALVYNCRTIYFHFSWNQFLPSCSTTERAASAGCGFLSQRAGPERSTAIQRRDRGDSEEAQPGKPPALPVLGRPSGSWKCVCGRMWWLQRVCGSDRTLVRSLLGKFSVKFWSLSCLCMGHCLIQSSTSTSCVWIPALLTVLYATLDIL